MRRGKNYLKAKEKVSPALLFNLEEAVERMKESAYAKFDETVEMWVRLGVNPKHADQMVRGTVVLPYGTGREVKVLVLAKGEKEREASEAGADYVGSDEYIQKINQGWTDVDYIVATPDMMGQVGKLGKILGRRGLMPNPKSGTVTFEVAKTVKELKKGKIEYRVDKTGNIGVPIGKRSYAPEQLVENAQAFLEAVLRSRPPAVKGQYLKSATICSTMGVGIRLDISTILSSFKK